MEPHLKHPRGEVNGIKAPSAPIGVGDSPARVSPLSRLPQNCLHEGFDRRWTTMDADGLRLGHHLSGVEEEAQRLLGSRRLLLTLLLICVHRRSSAIFIG